MHGRPDGRQDPRPRTHKEKGEIQKMKRMLALLLALVMCFSLAACGGGNDDAPAADNNPPADNPPADAGDTEPAADGESYNIGVAIYQFNDNFMTLYRQDIQAFFDAENEKAGYDKYNVTLVDSNNDMATQTNQIQTFITQKMDAIICNLVQTSSAEAIVNLCVDADIPLVLINREPPGDEKNEDGSIVDESAKIILDNPKVCYVGADARQSGTYQGEIIAALEDKGDANGDGVVSYVMIEGDPENSDAQYRTQFSIKALEDAGIKVECLVDQIGNWDTAQGQTIAANALTQHGNKIDVIFCNNDGMALGAFAAIQAAGRTVGEDIYLVGVDALDECVEMVNNGTMTGTVKNDDVGQANKACEVTIELLEGKDIQNYYWVDYTKVVKE